MKRIVKTIGTIILVTLLSLGLASCSSEDTDTTGDNDLFINFTLDGTAISIQGDAEVVSAFSGNGFQNLSINGDNGETTGSSSYVRISLQIPDKTVSSGTFSFSADISQTDVYRCSLVTGSTSQLLGTGSITIIANNGDIIEGTFSGTTLSPNGSTANTITNGSFKAISNDN